jgi:hypothetical protein
VAPGFDLSISATPLVRWTLVLKVGEYVVVIIEGDKLHA